jgi:D-cysteine desulfhydrase family pyridoxal phosphate-dependent enzyme
MKRSKILHRVIQKYPSAGLSFLPTPIHKLTNLSNTLGVPLFCKRDDLTGFAMGGNKTRKLDYLIQDALCTGSDCLVTYGSNQSNWCRMTAAAGARYGLKVYLVLAGCIPERPTANLLLDHLAGAHIRHLDTEDDEELCKATIEETERRKQEGLRPYYMPVGGSVPVGILGYVRAFHEILEYSELTGIIFSTIFLATGSAGTQSGLVVGKLISGWEGKIIGMAVSRDSISQEEKVTSLVKETLAYLYFPISSEQITDAVHCDDRALGEGYRRITPACREAIQLFAREEGIFLDEVYTGKAAAGLIDLCHKGICSATDPLLFIHTGGSIQLFE